MSAVIRIVAASALRLQVVDTVTATLRQGNDMALGEGQALAVRTLNVVPIAATLRAGCIRRSFG